MFESLYNGEKTKFELSRCRTRRSFKDLYGPFTSVHIDRNFGLDCPLLILDWMFIFGSICVE
jgi:hypothetical protein